MLSAYLPKLCEAPYVLDCFAPPESPVEEVEDSRLEGHSLVVCFSWHRTNNALTRYKFNPGNTIGSEEDYNEVLKTLKGLGADLWAANTPGVVPAEIKHSVDLVNCGSNASPDLSVG